MHKGCHHGQVAEWKPNQDLSPVFRTRPDVSFGTNRLDIPVQIKYVTRSFGKAAALLVIEAIPMFSCPDCGESCFSARTLHEIERIKALRKSVAVSRPIPVASFQPAAA